MTKEEAKKVLENSDRHELRLHDSDEREVTWYSRDEKPVMIATGYCGWNPGVEIFNLKELEGPAAGEFDGKDALELLHYGNLTKIEYND
jgi:pyruvate formate-lyase activating enzyme-like uncharacterized protein